MGALIYFHSELTLPRDFLKYLKSFYTRVERRKEMTCNISLELGGGSMDECVDLY